MDYIIHTLTPRKRQNVVLLGDGFFARGFLRHINQRKYHVTQIYRDAFINPQDMMYAFQSGKLFTDAWHFRDLFTLGPDVKVQKDIKELKLTSPGVCTINGTDVNFDHLVVGLGAAKSLTSWKDTINMLVKEVNDTRPRTLSDELRGDYPSLIPVVGMGPTGVEIAHILSKARPVFLYDTQSMKDVIPYVSLHAKHRLLRNWNITFNCNTAYKPLDPSGVHVCKSGRHLTVTPQFANSPILCVGTRPNPLTGDWAVSHSLMLCLDEGSGQLSAQVHVGGDCANTGWYKTGQIAYQQGVYVAKKLNGEIPYNEPFRSWAKGVALQIGDNKAIIDGHPYVPNGEYPAFVIKLYSMFFV